MTSETLNAGEECRRFELPSRLDIRAAAPLKQTLAALLDRQQPTVIVAEPVQQMSTACVQVLVAFMAASKSNGLHVTITQPSSEFLEAFHTLGLGGLPESWNVES